MTDERTTRSVLHPAEVHRIAKYSGQQTVDGLDLQPSRELLLRGALRWLLIGGLTVALVPAIVVLLRREPHYFTTGITLIALAAGAAVVLLGMLLVWLWSRQGRRRTEFSTPVARLRPTGLWVRAGADRPELSAPWEAITWARFVGRGERLLAIGVAESVVPSGPAGSGAAGSAATGTGGSTDDQRDATEARPADPTGAAESVADGPPHTGNNAPTAATPGGDGSDAAPMVGHDGSDAVAPPLLDGFDDTAEGFDDDRAAPVPGDTATDDLDFSPTPATVQPSRDEFARLREPLPADADPVEPAAAAAPATAGKPAESHRWNTLLHGTPYVIDLSRVVPDSGVVAAAFRDFTDGRIDLR